MPNVLCKQTDELSREEVHNNGTGSPSGDLPLQEVPALLAGLLDCLPHGSRLTEVSSEQTGFVRTDSKMDTSTLEIQLRGGGQTWHG